MNEHQNDPRPQPADGVRRRGLMQQAGLGAVAAGAVAAGATLASGEAQAQAIGDADVLNFALNLEYLEAEFYLFAATGRGLPQTLTTGTGALGGTIGGAAVPFRSPAIRAYAERIAVHEQAHVNFLRAALGANSVAKPALNLQSAFTTAAVAAGLIVQGQTFNPFADDVSFLLAAYLFEDVGVTAYAGAARLINNRDFLEAAAGLLAVEAYHAGAVRTLLANLGGGVACNQISALRRAASGANDDEGILITGNNYNFAPTDINALSYRRTTTQVLNIVYLGGASAGFGFYPNRMNGRIA